MAIEKVFKEKENEQVTIEMGQLEEGGIGVWIGLQRSIDITQQRALETRHWQFIEVSAPQLSVANVTTRFRSQKQQAFSYSVHSNQTLHPVEVAVNLTRLGLSSTHSQLYRFLVPQYKENSTSLVRSLQSLAVASQASPIFDVFIYLSVNTLLLNSMQVVGQLLLLNYTQPFHLFLFHKCAYNLLYTQKYRLDWLQVANLTDA